VDKNYGKECVVSEFEKAVKFVLDQEVVFQKGHYGDWNFVKTENTKGDRGGMTRYGIDKRSHEDVDIDKLTLEQAKEIYRKDYWLKGKCDQMPWPVSLAHFDACVNTGVGQAAKFLQRVVHTDVDGAVGPNTLKALVYACGVRGPVVVAEELATARKSFYQHLAEQNEDDKEFLDGWLNRVENLKKQIV
jgi:lysozyme family protein